MAASDRLSRALVVGSGWARHAAEALVTDPRVELCAVVGRGSERTRALANRLGVPSHQDIARAISQHAPTFAIVAAGSKHHEALVRPLLKAGVNVLCAHPVADADAVARLIALARTANVSCATDYTLRLCPPWLAALATLPQIGCILRVNIQLPSSTLIMGIDLALALGGTVQTVFASARYPAALAARRQKTPAAFAPSVLLEHLDGCVTSIVPMPHAMPCAAYRVTVSGERGRIDVALPSGDAVLIRYLGRGRVEQRRLHASASEGADPEELYGAAMRELTRRFISAVLDGSEMHAPLDHELRRRQVWLALKRATRERCAVPASSP